MAPSEPANQPYFALAAGDGTVVDCAFSADGLLCAPGGEPAWAWKNYALADMRARRSIECFPDLPEEARQSLLSPDDPMHVGCDDGWLHGAVTDTRHKHYAPAGEIDRFRFAFNDTILITARRHPLQSVDDIWRLVEQRRRAYHRPAELVEGVVVHALERLSREMTQLSGELDLIEDRVVSDAWDRETERLASVRRRLVSVHRQVSAVAGIFRHAEDLHHGEMPEHMADFVSRLATRGVTLLQESEQLQSRARLLQDEIMAKLTAESNRLLYVLSMLTAVLLPVSIVSGLFGMNVGGTPLGANTVGFWLVSALAILLAIGVYIAVSRIARRR